MMCAYDPVADLGEDPLPLFWKIKNKCGGKKSRHRNTCTKHLVSPSDQKAVTRKLYHALRLHILKKTWQAETYFQLKQL